MGVHSENAEGTEAKKLTYARTGQERQEYEQDHDASAVVDLADPELQRSLNILQMLDYISRQLDRHAGNFYIATDDNGRVTGVVGIDLDVSFGSGKQPESGKLESYGSHFVGIPEIADAAFRAKVLSVKPSELEAVLDGVLSDDEVRATVERFTYLCDVLRDMDPKKIINTGGWGADTVKQQGDKTSYIGKLKATTIAHEFDDGASPLLQQLDQLTFERSTLYKQVKPAVEAGTLTPKGGVALVDALVHAILTDPTLVNKRNDLQGLKRAETAVKVLKGQKQALLAEPSGDDADRLERLDAQLLAAEVNLQITDAVRKVAEKDYATAVEAIISQLLDFAIKFGRNQSRQTKAKAKPRQLANA
jgi:hypothetical protein